MNRFDIILVLIFLACALMALWVVIETDMTWAEMLRRAAELCPTVRPEIIEQTARSLWQDDASDPAWRPYTPEHLRILVANVRRVGILASYID